MSRPSGAELKTAPLFLFCNSSSFFSVLGFPGVLRGALVAPRLRQDNKLHPHSFMFFTADDRADNLILSGLQGRGQRIFLYSLPELQVPARDLGVVFVAQQGETMRSEEHTSELQSHSLSR